MSNPGVWIALKQFDKLPLYAGIAVIVSVVLGIIGMLYFFKKDKEVEHVE